MEKVFFQVPYDEIWQIYPKRQAEKWMALAV